MKIFQYWDTGVLPGDMHDWPTTFRDLNDGLDYELFDRESASEFIRSYYGTAGRDAFLSLRVPAMQADYLRLCLLETYGGLYCDADHRLKETLSTLLDDNPTDLMLSWGGQLNTAFMLFRNPGNLYIQACLDLCFDNIVNRRFSAAITATGPGIQNAIRALIDPTFLVSIDATGNGLGDRDFHELVSLAKHRIGKPSPELCDAFSAITIRHTFYIIRWMESEAPQYKSTDRHWLRWNGPIYDAR